MFNKVDTKLKAYKMGSGDIYMGKGQLKEYMNKFREGVGKLVTNQGDCIQEIGLPSSRYPTALQSL